MENGRVLRDEPWEQPTLGQVGARRLGYWVKMVGQQFARQKQKHCSPEFEANLEICATDPLLSPAASEPRRWKTGLRPDLQAVETLFSGGARVGHVERIGRRAVGDVECRPIG